jgi:3-phenylpropionate/trans-cinnamate dioxygenase ferredoxin reductase subunit
MMRRPCNVTLDGDTFYVNYGDLLLDGALMSGVELRHECRSGSCGTCRLRLVGGSVFGGTEEGSDGILACQARIVSDVRLETESAPEPVSLPARVVAMDRLAPDVIGLTLKLQESFDHFPGQYCKLQFRGYPERSYSPTCPLERAPRSNLLYFHIRRFPDGAVSSALSDDIRVGHRVRVSGPFGSAFLRREHPGRIVLVASGTGFAPMWSIAAAAITERPNRELILVAAARSLQSFYMHPALCRLALFPNVRIVPVVSEAQGVTSAIRCGRPTDYLPKLSQPDVVYASGSPAMTASVARVAAAAGAPCYTDPFVPSARVRPNLRRPLHFGWVDAARRIRQVA